MIVAKITSKQADELKGSQFATDNYFNPIQDAQGNWIISLQELMHCSIELVNTIELIEYSAVEDDLNFTGNE